MRGRLLQAVFLTVVAAGTAAAAPSVLFKSPGPGMHFTTGQPIVIFADLFDGTGGAYNYITCPGGEAYTPRTAPGDQPVAVQCASGNPIGWPQLRVLVDGTPQMDIVTNSIAVQGTTSIDSNGNPNPADFFRFKMGGLSVGTHQVMLRAWFSTNGVSISTQDGSPMDIVVDAEPSNMTILRGNGQPMNVSGSLVLKNTLVVGYSGISGTVSDADIEGSIFEDDGPMDITIAGAAKVINNEFRANNRLTFSASDPSVPFMVSLHGSGASQKLFQGNRVGAGQLEFTGQNWLIGGDTDDLSNVFIGPRCVLNVSASKSRVVGNYGHHNYRGGWSQGYNFVLTGSAPDLITEHNFLRAGSWPGQDMAGEFRYNVIFGYGHNWVRTLASNTSLHHNLFAPEGHGDLNEGIFSYQGETGLRIYNNTFDGGGSALGDFLGPMIRMDKTSQIASLRNNLFTYARNQSNGNPGYYNQEAAGGGRNEGAIGGSNPNPFLYADYNAFYAPDNANRTNYFTNVIGAGAHDVSGTGQLGVMNGQLAAHPFAGTRIAPLESLVDEGAVWQGTQKMSQILAAFRARYAPKAGAPVIDAGDPQDNDSQGRRADIGAIDSSGHDQDKFGKFGTAPGETVPPTVFLTAPTAGASVAGTYTLTANAADNVGVVLVQFLVDGATVGQDAVAPYQFDLNAGLFTNGNHMFSAKAWDAAGNFAVSAPVTASVAGDVMPPARPKGLRKR